MQSLQRSAAGAATVIFLAFLIHNVNALYVEPVYLGFKNPAVDYANLDKLKNAIGSVPWTLSGLGHFASGFACVVLALTGRQMFRDYRSAAGRLLLGAGFVAAIGFFLTGIADLAGNGAVKLLAAQNPDLERGAYLAASISRIVYNCMAQVGLGWFAWQLSWCGLKTGLLPKGFCRFGYLSGLSGLVMGVIFFPVYLQLVLIWAGWLAVIMWRQAGRQPISTNAGSTRAINRKS
jgi:hypothetical protein